MWRLFNTVDPTGRSICGAILCTLLKNWLSTRQTELLSEILTWILLPAWFRIANKLDGAATNAGIHFLTGISRSTSPALLWVAAAAIVTSCLLRAESDFPGFVPALTIPILISQQHVRAKSHALRTFDPLSPALATRHLWFIVVASIISLFTLSGWDLQTSALSIVPVAIPLMIYIVMFRKFIEDSQSVFFENETSLVSSFSLRVVVALVLVLGIQTHLFGFNWSTIPPPSLVLAKLLSWYFLIRTAQLAPLWTLTVIETFSCASTVNPLTHISEMHAVSHAITSIFALGQISYFVPMQAKSRSLIALLSFIPLVSYISGVLDIRLATSAAVRFDKSHEHPVETLFRQGDLEFDELLQRQSQNYTAAYTEYKRRYNMEPPPGFEAWYKFAASHDSPIIDDFDTIFTSVSPFWKLSGQSVVGMMQEARKMPGSEVWECEFVGSSAETHCTHHYRTCDRSIKLLFNTLLGNMTGVLPDLKFLANHLDEPRVAFLPPGDEKDNDDSRSLTLKNLAQKPVWGPITQLCTHQNTVLDTNLKAVATNTYGLPFVTDLRSNMDLCQHPEYQYTHALFMRPTSFPLFEGLAPILSTGSPSTMGDILFPSPAYIEPEFKYDESHDVDWDKKKNNLYWAGSTTGGVARDETWKRYQRQRFVRLAQNRDGHHYYLRDQNGKAWVYKSSFLNGRLFDVAFSRLLQCKGRYCRDEKAEFNFKFWQDKDQALKSRLVFDIDGNGISGRYYKLLASRSAPLKQTLLREWHDDRLIPWVHYIPVSSSMKELPELVTYLTSTERGRARAKEIADRGRLWFQVAFREVDLQIYTYRLLLELARLQDPNREAIL